MATKNALRQAASGSAEELTAEKKTDGSQVDAVLSQAKKPEPEKKKPESDKVLLNLSGKNRHKAVTEGRKDYLRIMSEREDCKMTAYILQLIDDDMWRNAGVYEREKKIKVDKLLSEIERLRK